MRPWQAGDRVVAYENGRPYFATIAHVSDEGRTINLQVDGLTYWPGTSMRLWTPPPTNPHALAEWLLS